MGYSGLSKATDSDSAASLAGSIMEEAIDLMRDELQADERSVDTDGVVAVALVLEGLMKSYELWKYDTDFSTFLEKVEKKLGHLIQEVKDDVDEEWEGDAENKQFHLRAYQRMQRNMKKFQEKIA